MPPWQDLTQTIRGVHVSAAQRVLEASLQIGPLSTP